jgi:hypothetical protein
MTKSISGKVLMGLVLAVGSAGAGQWSFQRESTLVPAGTSLMAVGIPTLRVHAPVLTANAAATAVTVQLLSADGQVAGEMIDTRAATTNAKQAPEEIIVLARHGRTVRLHFKDRALWMSDGITEAAASFDARTPATAMGAFAPDLILIGELQAAARATIDRAAVARPVVRASLAESMGLGRVVRAVFGRGAVTMHDPVCHTEPAHAHCGGGFGASKSSACAYSQQEAHNECALATGWCIGCCAWIGSGCDCFCLMDDLACMCESCGGTCGPEIMHDPADQR